MFDKTTITTVVQNKIGTVGYSLEEPNRFVALGTNEVYIQSDLHLKVFNDLYTLKYYRNLVPKYRTPGQLSFDLEIYPNDFVGQTSILVISYIPMLACFGQKLTTTSQYAYIDLVSETIRTSSEVFFTTPSNYNTPVYFENQTYNMKNFFYSTNTLFQTILRPSFEHLCYPASFDFRSSSLFANFERLNREYVDISFPLPDSFSLSSTVRLYRPKVMLKPASYLYSPNWYSFNTQTMSFVEQSPASGGRFTFDEFRSKGTTFSNYLKIPRSSFLNLYEGDWYVLVNNYILPIYMSSRFWTEAFDLYQFLWVSTIPNKVMFVPGNI
jgi:hypothetical protein